jgi:palmitoyltransferase ZDHHC9/14/18
MISTGSSIILITVLFLLYIAKNISPIVTVITSLSLVIVMISFLLTGLSDPGIILRNMSNVDGDEENPTNHPKIECSICQITRPPKARHCHECGVCIDEVGFFSQLPSIYCLPLPSYPSSLSTLSAVLKLDHHCPFTGHCIGKRNLTMFLVFTWSLGFHILLVGGVGLYYIVFRVPS